MPALIGFDMLHYALLSDDNVTTGIATYTTPQRIVGAVSANVNPNSSVDTLFADNGPMDTASSLGKIDLELGAAEFTNAVQATILGHTYINGMLVRKGNDIAPWVAIGGRCLKSNGAYRYFWLVKGKMQDPEAKHETKSDKVNFQTPTLKGSFVRRDCDDFWIVEYDTDSAEFLQSVVDLWFTKVVDISDLPLGCTVVPADGAMNVDVGSAVVVTFSKALANSGLASTTNFTIATSAAPGTPITSTVTIDAALKVVTITPSAALIANTEYTVTIKTAVGLATQKITTFKTA